MIITGFPIIPTYNSQIVTSDQPILNPFSDKYSLEHIGYQIDPYINNTIADPLSLGGHWFSSNKYKNKKYNNKKNKKSKNKKIKKFKSTILKKSKTKKIKQQHFGRSYELTPGGITTQPTKGFY